VEIKQTFRLIIMAHWVLIVLAFAAFALSEDSALSEEQAKEYRELLLETDSRGMASMIIIALLTVSGSVGLFLLQKWARLMYLAAAALAVFWTAGQGTPYLNLPFVEAILDMLLIVTGITIGLIYFSPIKDELVSFGSGSTTQ
jgi:hypothetical protein